MATLPRPPFDPATQATVDMMAASTKTPETVTQAFVDQTRAGLKASTEQGTKDLLANPSLKFENRVIPGPRGDIPLVIMTPSQTSEGPRPGIVHIHGGGMFAGDVYLGTDAKWATDFDAVTIMVDYRLAPEAQDLALVEDCYAALLWVGEHLSELNIDPARLLLEGESAGGALAAGAALMTRDKGGPQLCGLLLRCPMLDDRNNSTSCKQYWDSGTFTGATNQFAWKCVLGDRAGGGGVSYYVSPGRETDLSGLPETYIDVGSAEPFRDESVAFASRLWECGTQAELHVWPGGPHGFSTLVPDADISKWNKSTEVAWIRRKLGL